MTLLDYVKAICKHIMYLSEMLFPCSNSEHDLRSSYDNLLVVPATETVTYGDRAFSILGPSL